MADNKTPRDFISVRTQEINDRELKDFNMRHVGSTLGKYFGSNMPLISAMLGNIDVETGGTFDFKQEQKGGNGYGLFQFDFHKPFYKKFLKENQLEDSVDSQVRYTYENIYGNQQNVLGEGNAEDLRDSFASKTNPIELSDDIMNIFLKPGKPHADRRRESTRMYSAAITPAN
jgi:hypothetical protein